MSRKSASGKYSGNLYFIESETPDFDDRSKMNLHVQGPYNSKPTSQLKKVYNGVLITYKLDENMNYIRQK